jgi:AcrR family transcriptional regulator
MSLTQDARDPAGFAPAPHAVRSRRSSDATRAAILAVATEAFTHNGYETVSLRDIGARAGVDAAMAIRYFGSKEALFRAVLDLYPERPGFLMGERSQFGRRVADALLPEGVDADDVRCLLMIMRSLGSAHAMAIIGETAGERFTEPMTRLMGGHDAPIRARLATSIILGVAMTRDLNAGGASAEDRDVLRDRLAELLQGLLDGKGTTGRADTGDARERHTAP